MAHKRRLYLDAGAEEMWVCDEKGAVRFFDDEGEIGRSRLAPNSPSSINVHQ